VLILLSQEEDSSFHHHIGLQFKEESNGMLQFELDFIAYGAETWTLLALD
jgi:hypothetical protein